ncbi:hypothetical protein ASZ90_006109 [hydrocarbon metagenome]|uniref:Transmembrane protein n=1 Tax=hydrocarbon metagenome TaxID=938273 RepID=A0A0W8FT54_9ZZZZ
MRKRKTKATTTTQSENDAINPQKHRFSIMSSFLAFSGKFASSSYLKWTLIILLPVLILLIYPVDRLDYDLWWQMTLGKYYLTHHTLTINHSIFSWTPADPTWVYNTCLGSIIIYLAYSFMGGFGLWTFQWLIFLGVFFSFYIFLRLIRRQLDVTSITIIAAIGIACSLSCSYYKPELFSVLFFCWMIFIFFYVKVTHRTFLFYLYPLMFALWANLHGGFILGFGLFACFFTGELLNRIYPSEESFSVKDLVNLGAASALSVTATLLNPYGINYLLSICNAIISDTYDITSKFIQAYVSLWPYLKEMNISFFKLGQTAWIMTIMMFVIGCLFLYELIKKRTCDFTLLITNIVLYWASMRATRASYLFPFGFFFSFFYLIHRWKLKNITDRATIISLFLFIFFFINISYFTFRYNTDNKWFGAGLNSFVPAEEVSFLKKYRLDGPIFNDYVIGGYLLWDLYPAYKVFIDPRMVPYSKQIAPDYWAFTGTPITGETLQRFNKKYPFKIAIIHYRELPLIFDFLGSDEWRLLYFEQNAAILIHKSMIPTIPPEISLIDLGPLRFQNVKNPEVLLNVFTLYVNLDPDAGRVVYDIYKNNISDYYKLKTEHLQTMEDDIRQKEYELQFMANGYKLPPSR